MQDRLSEAVTRFQVVIKEVKFLHDPKIMSRASICF